MRAAKHRRLANHRAVRNGALQIAKEVAGAERLKWTAIGVGLALFFSSGKRSNVGGRRDEARWSRQRRCARARPML
jgi:hypothetical protein